MDFDFSVSNLSKIKPKLRTSGSISQPRRKAGSTLKDIGETKAKIVNITKPEDYLNRLREAYEKTDDPKLKEFITNEIKKIRIQRGER